MKRKIKIHRKKAKRSKFFLSIFSFSSLLIHFILTVQLERSWIRSATIIIIKKINKYNNNNRRWWVLCKAHFWGRSVLERKSCLWQRNGLFIYYLSNNQSSLTLTLSFYTSGPGPLPFWAESFLGWSFLKPISFPFRSTWCGFLCILRNRFNYFGDCF